jgi:Putative transposase
VEQLTERIPSLNFTAEEHSNKMLPCGSLMNVAAEPGDSAHYNEQKLLTLSLDEFLRRFLLHLLPKRFVRIRNFGFLTNRRRTTSLPLCFQLLPSRSAPQSAQDCSTTDGANDLWRCPQCAGPMVIIERLTPAEIQLRSPPLPVTAAA